MVPNAAECELFVIAVELDGVNTFVIVESGTGASRSVDPSMGLRPALGRVVLKDVRVPAANLLGGANLSDTDRTERYAEIVRRSRLGWAALASAPARPSSSTKKYVNEREAFGGRSPPPGSGLHGRQPPHRARRPAPDHAARCIPPRPGHVLHREAGLARRYASDRAWSWAWTASSCWVYGCKEHPVER